VTFSGPRRLVPLLKRCRTVSSSREPGTSYYISIVLVCGPPSDFDEFVAEVIDSSSQEPLTVVIIGVGGGDFSVYEKLNSTKILQQGAAVQYRSNFKFVKYDPTQAVEYTIQKALSTVTTDTRHFMKMKKIQPPTPVDMSAPPPSEVLSFQHCDTPIVDDLSSLALHDPPSTPSHLSKRTDDDESEESDIYAG
ncbi:hypothetical protein ADUPG1_014199, partial [Aduncisulcus paluster]